MMFSIKRILGKLNGLRYPQEFLCISLERFSDPLAISIVTNSEIKDITTHHLFVGYNPLILAIPGDQLPGDNKKKLELELQSGDNKTVAYLKLSHIRDQQAGNKKVSYFIGNFGKHRFLNSFNQFIISLNNRLYNKKQGNVFLHSNLLKQVQIAYSVPRTISLITVGSNNQFNLFPTDLHGPVDDDHYIISLRQNGKAAKQVQETKKILVCNVNADIYKAVYALGKNHMQEMKPKENFPFSAESSEFFHLPIPVRSLLCREIELTDFFDHGIHRLFLFRVLNKSRLPGEPATLAHIHAVYASWRLNHGKQGNYLIR